MNTDTIGSSLEAETLVSMLSPYVLLIGRMEEKGLYEMTFSFKKVLVCSSFLSLLHPTIVLKIKRRFFFPHSRLYMTIISKYLHRKLQSVKEIFVKVSFFSALPQYADLHFTGNCHFFSTIIIIVSFQKTWRLARQRISRQPLSMVLVAVQWMETATPTITVIYVHTQIRKLNPGGEWT